MHSIDVNVAGTHDMTQLHAATCQLMTRFINGHHCPKLAHVIVHQLQQLAAHPATQLSDSRDMYLQLLEHWQNVSNTLLEQKAARRQIHRFH
ncbi:hypothetical protein IVG45_11385 [Methylomonas sp. LL1]|uniref:hypothetical protein n=1 Tax=Methylomonas sp. LL1 TaxID=2785785 RepID=UPI0018C3A7E0|nr:hypothetical protein [Methylomonas sp. LL1]QPK61507.1 hypothetical protein IVG45_11385 [Methylomonas sp. LL1]